MVCINYIITINTYDLIFPLCHSHQHKICCQVEFHEVESFCVYHPPMYIRTKCMCHICNSSTCDIRMQAYVRMAKRCGYCIKHIKLSVGFIQVWPDN